MMRSRLRRLVGRFVPESSSVSAQERLRAAFGALVGLLATGLIARWIGGGAELPVMIAPMGASAVLLFAVPSSPLAQPWSILGGNLVAALVGVTAAWTIPDPILAAALAGACAIGLMTALRCLHPPSGAVALTAVLGGPVIRELGYGFVLWPVLANSLLLLAAALVFNNLTGRAYPHVAPKAGLAPAAGPAASDLDAALEELDEVFDIGRGDLQAILHRAFVHAGLRQAGGTTCAAVMAPAIHALAPDTPLREVPDLMRRHGLAMVPVTDEHAGLVGVVTQGDLIDKAVWDRRGPRLGLGRRLRLTLERGRAPHGSVADVMTTGLPRLRPDTPAAAAALALARAGLRHAPVLGADGRLVGTVAQADLTAALIADTAARAEAPESRHAVAAAEQLFSTSASASTHRASESKGSLPISG